MPQPLPRDRSPKLCVCGHHGSIPWRDGSRGPAVGHARFHVSRLFLVFNPVGQAQYEKGHLGPPSGLEIHVSVPRRVIEKVA